MSLYEPSTSSTQSLYPYFLLTGILSLTLFVPNSNFEFESGPGFPSNILTSNGEENITSKIFSSVSENAKKTYKVLQGVLALFGTFQIVGDVGSIDFPRPGDNIEISSTPDYPNPEDSSPNPDSASNDLNLVESQSTDGPPTYVLEGKDVFFSHEGKTVGGLGITDDLNAKVIPAL